MIILVWHFDSFWHYSLNLAVTLNFGISTEVQNDFVVDGVENLLYFFSKHIASDIFRLQKELATRCTGGVTRW